MRLPKCINGINIFFAITALLSLFFPLLPSSIERFNLSIYILFSTISILSLTALFYFDKTNYSVNKTFYLFYYFFFGISPLLQFQNQVIFFDSIPLPPYAYLKAGCILLFSQILYAIIYHYFKRQRFFNKHYVIRNNNTVSNKDLLTLTICVCLIFFYLIDFNLIRIIEPPFGGWRKTNVKHGIVGFGLFLIVRVFIVIIYLYFELKQENKSKLYRILLLSFFIIICFPTSLPRSMVATFYLPVLLVNFTKYFVRINYILIYFFGFFFFFPLLNYFRSGINTVDLGFNLFVSPHLDAFSNLASIFYHNVVTNGKQLLGSLLFFIPSTLWKDKITPTGELLAQYTNQTHTNVAIPLFAEGYVNFGILGVILLVVLVAFLNTFMDGVICNSRASIKIIFYLFLGFEFYLMRGDLYSTFKYLYSILCAFVVFWTLICLLKKRNKFF